VVSAGSNVFLTSSQGCPSNLFLNRPTLSAVTVQPVSRVPETLGLDDMVLKAPHMAHTFTNLEMLMS
jgi:hypothetical protein